MWQHQIGFVLPDAFCATLHGHPSGPAQLDDPEFLQQFHQRVELLLVTGGFHDERFGGDVDDVGAEDVDDLEDRAAGGRVRPHLDHDEFPADGGPVGDVFDVDDIHQFVDLFHHLLHIIVGSIHHKGHAGQPWGFRMTHRQAFDVEAPLPPAAGDAVQDARTVLHQRHNGV